MVNYNYIKATLILIALTFLVNVGSAQSDKAVIHMDRPYYVTGDVIVYQVYLPESFADQTGKIQVLLQSEEGDVFQDYFWKLENQKVSGYFKIPFGMPSGTYNIGVYAVDDSDEPVMIADTWVSVYNDFQIQDLPSLFPKRVPAQVDQSNALSVLLDKEVYTPGTEVKVSIKSDQDWVGSAVSLSVTDAQIIGQSADQTLFESSSREASSVVIDDKMHVHGTISIAETDMPAKIGVVSAYSSSMNQIFYSKSDDEGAFTTSFDEFYGKRNIQISGYLFGQVADTRVKLRYPTIEQSPEIVTAYDGDINEFINHSQRRKLIHQYYNHLETPLDFEPLPNVEKLEVTPNKVIEAENYVAFENTGVFLDEVLGQMLNFVKKGDEWTAKLFNPDNKVGNSIFRDYYYEKPPVFIVDGKMTKNLNYIADMKLSEIELISVYNDRKDIRKQFGVFGNFGYVLIDTKQDDRNMPAADEEDIIAVPGMAPELDYPVSIKRADSNAPELRSTIYWHPEVPLSKKGATEFSFTTSDDIGTFLIQIVGRDSSGNMHKRTVEYEVQRGK